MKPKTVIALVVLGLVLFAPATAEAQARLQEQAAWPDTAWDTRMRLGRPADTDALNDGTQRRKVVKGQCRRWRAIATQLGESYAGYTLRSSVIRRICDGPVTDRTADVWDWPWAGMAEGRLLPPRMHKIFGEWQIRCGTGQWRNRCAAIGVISPQGDDEKGQNEASVIAHFVIDMVAGRESVLWRLYVPGDAGDAAKRETSKLGERVASSIAARTDPRVIEYDIGGRSQKERFTTCSATGCILESGLGRSSDVATQLWDGEAVGVMVVRPSFSSVSISIPAKGFRAALGELTRLRRIDEAGRR